MRAYAYVAVTLVLGAIVVLGVIGLMGAAQCP
jgi:membrane-associated PAP2 superfamily phosphatase